MADERLKTSEIWLWKILAKWLGTWMQDLIWDLPITAVYTKQFNSMHSYIYA